MRILTQRLLTAALFLLFAQAAFAQTADEIVQKHIAALGGRAALEKIKSRVTTGTITLSLPVGGDVTGSIEVYNVAPNKSRTAIKIDLSALGAGMVTQDQRFDGTSGYVIDSLQGNHEMPAEQVQLMKNNIFPTPLLNYKENSTMELQGKEKVGERDAYVLIGKPKAGPAVRLYLDAETYLPVKSVVKVNVPQLGTEVEQTTELSDYRDVDAVKVPFQSHVSSSLQTLVIKVTKVEQNTTIDPAMFSKP